MAEFIFSKETTIDVILDPEADTGIRKIWRKVEQDIALTTKASCAIHETCAEAEQAIIVATLGCGTLPKLLEKRFPKIQQLNGQWETYGFYLADHPIEGVKRAIVIVGSDKLGTIYGMFHLSELLGVTAWGFWGDVTFKTYDKVVFGSQPADERSKKENVSYVQILSENSREPSVKYRGFFINDEWPCFGSWTFSHYKGFTAEMYDKVFEYLLRMKGNYLWPAMWTSSFLLDGPGMASMELADEYGIYIGMSHHEPCMRSSEEWDLCKGEETPYGTEWDYVTNKEGLLCYWEDGLKRSKGHRVFPTIGMRGERDSKMLGEDSTIEENVRLLKEIITNQRKLIAKHINPDLDQVPQLFAVYKEVEDYYFGGGQEEGLKGFEELEGVTLLLCEDNFGNMRALPDAEERTHKGGFGMYYHLDYHGGPVSYEWVNSTPLSRIREQMTEAYEYGIREVWIVNVGDLKFQEYPLGYFMELAYDYDTWGEGGRYTEKDYTDTWVKNQFGAFATKEEQKEIAWVLEETARINGLRRPESCNDTVYHPAHYREGRRMMERSIRLEGKNEALMAALAAKPCGEAYYSMVYYPAAASANLLLMHLSAGLNHLYAAQGKASANLYGEKLNACIQYDRELSKNMAAFREGKWKGMEQALHIGFTKWNSEDWRYPVRCLVYLPEEPRLVVSRVDETRSYTNEYFPVPLEIHDFLEPGTEKVTIEISNGGQGILEWKIEERYESLELSAYEGKTSLTDEIEIRVNWKQVPVEKVQEFTFHIRTSKEMVPLKIRVKRRDLGEIPKGTCIAKNGIFVLDAIDYVKQIPGCFKGEEVVFQKLDDYGKYNSGVKAMPVTACFHGEEQAPSLLYAIWAEEPGNYNLKIHTSPANPLVYGGRLTLKVSINDTESITLPIVSEDYRGGDHTCAQWTEAVLNQEHICQTTIHLTEGYNQIRIYGQEPGIVLERLVICDTQKELKPSYFGPEKTYHKE